MTFKQSLATLITIPYNEHYIPLNILWYYFLFQIFGLNYFPFELGVVFFHTLNSFLLFYLISRVTKSFLLAAIFTLVFGLAYVSIENIIWSLGINYVLSGLFVFLAFLFEERPRLSIISLILSPLFHDITILMPFAFACFAFLRAPKFPNRCVLFSLVGLFNLVLLLLFSGNRIFDNSGSGLITLAQIPVFVVVGILRGTILRFLLPESHFLKGNNSFQTISLLLLSLGIFSTLFLAFYKLLKDTKRWKGNIQTVIQFLPFIVLPYLAAAPARAIFGIGQAGISRYTYIPFFFILLLAATLLTRYPKAIKPAMAVFATFLIININANIRFNNDFWKPMTARDRQFAQDVSYLIKNNAEVFDLSVPGINPKITLSKLWFLYPQNHSPKFLEATNLSMNSIATNSSATTVAIYSKLLGDYQKKLD